MWGDDSKEMRPQTTKARIKMVVGETMDKEEVRAEWQAVIDVTKHFNDLLMRLRSFGLPVVGTVAGAGLTLGLNNKFGNIPDWSSAAFVGANAVGVTLLVPFLLIVRGWARKGQVRLTPSEIAMWTSVPVLALAMAGGYVYLCLSGAIDLKDKHSLNAGPLILFFALSVLVVLYALDRFYYFKLLMGAVNRAETLERELGYTMTRTISEFIEPQHAASIITLMYYVPGIAGYLALMLLVGFNPIIAT
jgi:hypothetical protein